MHGTAWTTFADAALALAAARLRDAADLDAASSGVRSAVSDIAGDMPDFDEAREALRASLADDTDPFSSLVANAAMSPEEAEAFAICAAVSADVRRQRLIGWLQDDLNASSSCRIQRKWTGR